MQNLPARLTTPSIEPRILSLLSNNARFVDGEPKGWECPAVGDDERLACRAAAARLEEALRPGRGEDVVALLAALKGHCRNVPKHPDGVWASMLRDYQHDLAEYPTDIVQEAVTQWRRAEPWWPAISDLLKLAKPLLEERRAHLWRAEAIARGNARPSRKTFVPDPDNVKAETLTKLGQELARLKAMPGPA